MWKVWLLGVLWLGGWVRGSCGADGVLGFVWGLLDSILLMRKHLYRDS